MRSKKIKIKVEPTARLATSSLAQRRFLGWQRDIPYRMNYSKRIGMLRRRMSGLAAEQPVAGLLVTHLPDIRWLCGFTGSSGALAVTRRRVRLFTDGRYTAQAAEEVGGANSGAKVEIVPSGAVLAAVQWLAAQVAVGDSATTGAVGFDSGYTTVADLERLKAGLPAKLRRRLLMGLGSPIEKLRWIKDDDELAIMAEAAALGDALFAHLLGFIRPGLKETAVAAELEFEARMRGAEGMSFESIVASGARSALPHGRATQAELPRRGFLTLDFGVILKGYCSDMTRTVHLGEPTVREREVYEVVLAAQEAAVATVIAGAECGAVDEVARSVLRGAGMAEAFSHSTGHGVGLEIHEGPRVGAKQKERLAAGMVITIEPGAYLGGEFGVRIEDMVVVTRTGGRVLTMSPKAMIEL